MTGVWAARRTGKVSSCMCSAPKRRTRCSAWDSTIASSRSASTKSPSYHLYQPCHCSKCSPPIPHGCHQPCHRSKYSPPIPHGFLRPHHPHQFHCRYLWAWPRTQPPFSRWHSHPTYQPCHCRHGHHQRRIQPHPRRSRRVNFHIYYLCKKNAQSCFLFFSYVYLRMKTTIVDSFP